MNSMIRSIIGILLILVITFSAITIFQNIGKRIKVDITDQKIYTLSEGTKNILGKLNQPITVRLYYAETAARKGPDQIRYFNNYFNFVRELLEEYEAAANGMIKLEVIDPKAFTDDEAQAIRYGLKRFPITEEDNFYFGLAIQTPFGIEKTIPFFAPDRQNFVEYDISYLIDTAATRQKRKIGILSSLPVTGDDVSGYMEFLMKQQGQEPKPAWGIVSQLKQEYEVTKVEPDQDEIKDIDILIVIHPKNLSTKTLFSIDQFVLKGGRTIVCVDPYCLSDPPNQQQMQMGAPPNLSSDLNTLLNKWSLDVPANTFAGDKLLAIGAKEKIIGNLQLTSGQNCFNKDNVATSELNSVQVVFSGVIKELPIPEGSPEITRTPIVTTTPQGNSWKIDSAFELMRPIPKLLMDKFTEGDKPVAIGYRLTGKFQSAFPDGIEVASPIKEKAKSDEPLKEETIKITGIKQAEKECIVMVFSDVDFITDRFAYRNTIFGKSTVGDNSALLVNSVGELTGSTDLISIRSRGNFTRPFTRIDKIEAAAEKATKEKINAINKDIKNFQEELNNIIQQAQAGDQEVMGSAILKKKREVEAKIRLSEKQRNDIQKSRRQEIETLGSRLKAFCMLLTPLIILLIAIIIGTFRTVRKRHYISHASDS